MPVDAWIASSKPAQPSQFGGATLPELPTMDVENANTEVPAEMKAWEHYAIKRLGRAGGREFEPRAIPILQAARIQTALKACITADEVRALFAAERGDAELARANDLLERALAKLDV